MTKVSRDIIRIDEDLCDGCGDCISSCAEGALEIVNGKARLRQEKFCDGAGACLGHCPTGALTIERREVEQFDAVAVRQDLVQGQPEITWTVSPIQATTCPGTQSRQLASGMNPPNRSSATLVADGVSGEPTPTALAQWPVQLVLVPPRAPYFQNAELLVTADCVPFAHASYHRDFLAGKAVVVGCPKLDDLQGYVEKLTAIFRDNDLKSVEVLLMEVPCCGGIGRAAQIARDRAGADFPLKITTISVQGRVLGSQEIEA
jgi:NAD-dependent dihydropyrimidine dehydrogenase PreA subunit